MGSSGGGRVSGRALYLELVSLGIDPKAGHVAEVELTCSEIAALMRPVGENQAGLKEVLTGDTSDLVAVRGEGLW